MHKLVIIIRTLLCIWRLNINDKQAVNFLLTQGANTCIKIDKGKTPVQFAVECMNVEDIDSLESWGSAVELSQSEKNSMGVGTEEMKLNLNELKNKLFLPKNKYGITAWHRAALEGSLEELETLWSWAKEVELNTDELLLSQTGEGYTAFLLATSIM